MPTPAAILRMAGEDMIPDCFLTDVWGYGMAPGCLVSLALGLLVVISILVFATCVWEYWFDIYALTR